MKRAIDFVNEARAAIENLTVEQAKAEYDAGTAILVDLRDVREIAREGRIPGAVSAPRGMLEWWVDPTSEYHRSVFQPEGRYIFYCALGHRSALATARVQEMGYTNVAHIHDGFGGWRDAGMPVERKDG